MVDKRHVWSRIYALDYTCSEVHVKCTFCLPHSARPDPPELMVSLNLQRGIKTQVYLRPQISGSQSATSSHQHRYIVRYITVRYLTRGSSSLLFGLAGIEMEVLVMLVIPPHCAAELTPVLARWGIATLPDGVCSSREAPLFHPRDTMTFCSDVRDTVLYPVVRTGGGLTCFIFIIIFFLEVR